MMPDLPPPPTEMIYYVRDNGMSKQEQVAQYRRTVAHLRKAIVKIYREVKWMDCPEAMELLKDLVQKEQELMQVLNLDELTDDDVRMISKEYIADKNDDEDLGW